MSLKILSERVCYVQKSLRHHLCYLTGTSVQLRGLAVLWSVFENASAQKSVQRKRNYYSAA